MIGQKLRQQHPHDLLPGGFVLELRSRDVPAPDNKSLECCCLPTGKCPLYIYEATGQLLHSEIDSNQVGCSCTWQRSLSREANIRATEEIPAPNQSWRGCDHPTSNWPYKGNQIPYLVPRTADCLSPLWSNTEHWPYAPGVCSVTGMSWWILHSWLVDYCLRDNFWYLHSGIPARSGILLSDMM